MPDVNREFTDEFRKQLMLESIGKYQSFFERIIRLEN